MSGPGHTSGRGRPTVLVLTYHAIEAGRSPLCIEPALFREHLDVISRSGLPALTIGELAAGLASGSPLDGPAVAITFDDGLASVVEQAAPLLAERRLPATVFCVAGRLGGRSDWPSAAPGGFVRPLASRDALRELVAAGVEAGSHGMAHEPLVTDDTAVLRRELVDSRAALEDSLQAPVRSFALPYGALPSRSARTLLEATYDAACTTEPGVVKRGADVHALPRVDAHYLRRPALLARAIEGSLGAYLRARGLGARARRAFRTDYARAA